MQPRDRTDAQRELLRDLEVLGLRGRRGHDLRRTFITLAQADGAPPHMLKWVTHGTRTGIMDQYTSPPWPPLCAEVAKLRVELREGKVLELPTAELQRRTKWAPRARKRWKLREEPGEPSRNRTYNLRIKSPLLYQLSYGPSFFYSWGARSRVGWARLEARPG